MTPDPYCPTCRGAGTVEPDPGATGRPWCRACSGSGLGEQGTESPLLGAPRGPCGAFCSACPNDVLWSFCMEPCHVKGPHRCGACGREYYATLG